MSSVPLRLLSLFPFLQSCGDTSRLPHSLPIYFGPGFSPTFHPRSDGMATLPPPESSAWPLQAFPRAFGMQPSASSGVVIVGTSCPPTAAPAPPARWPGHMKKLLPGATRISEQIDGPRWAPSPRARAQQAWRGEVPGSAKAAVTPTQRRGLRPVEACGRCRVQFFRTMTMAVCTEKRTGSCLSGPQMLRGL